MWTDASKTRKHKCRKVVFTLYTKNNDKIIFKN